MHHKPAHNPCMKPQVGRELKYVFMLYVTAWLANSPKFDVTPISAEISQIVSESVFH